MNRLRLVDWWFRNRSTGAITIAQFPNVAMWIVIGAAVGRRLVGDDSWLDPVLRWLGILALAWWSIDEIVRGVNPWRRVLGGLGLIVTVTGVLSAL